MKRNGCDVIGVPFECKDGIAVVLVAVLSLLVVRVVAIWVATSAGGVVGICRRGRFHEVEFDGVVARRGEKAFVRGDAEAVDLRVGEVDLAGADA